ncbi:hypothetical protein BR93DRAFT_529112 [Coniochaeta sp. PMI_546]|nr:hypothetical protein BR93DRAFT_529112 [Coniochaeta sp. PMI_546]
MIDCRKRHNVLPAPRTELSAQCSPMPHPIYHASAGVRLYDSTLRPDSAGVDTQAGEDLAPSPRSTVAAAQSPSPKIDRDCVTLRPAEETDGRLRCRDRYASLPPRRRFDDASLGMHTSRGARPRAETVTERDFDRLDGRPV